MANRSTALRLMAALLAFMLAFAAAPLAAQEAEEAEAPVFRWDGRQEGWFISNPANWQDVAAPEPVETATADFRTRARVVLDRNQTFRGQFRMDQHRLSMSWFLQGHTLTLSGEARIGSWRSSGTLQGGTLRLGEPEHPATVRFYVDHGAENTFTLAEDATLHTENVRLLGISESSGNRTTRGTLDLSAASLAENAFRADTLRLGSYRGQTAGRGGHGTLLLPPAVRTLEVGRMHLGVNARSRGAGDPSFARGTLHFGEGEQAALAVLAEAHWAVGDNASAELAGLPERLDLAIGTEEKPASWRVADNHLLGGSEGETAFEFAAPPGTLRVHASEIVVGRNTGQAGKASGVLDLSKMKFEAFHAANAVIGSGHAATGRLELPAGRAAFGELAVGGGGRLTLRAVAEGCLDVSGTIEIAEGGQVRILDAQAAGGAWLVRLAENRQEELVAALADGRLAVEGVPVGRLQVVLEEGVTELRVQ